MVILRGERDGGRRDGGREGKMGGGREGRWREGGSEQGRVLIIKYSIIDILTHNNYNNIYVPEF